MSRLDAVALPPDPSPTLSAYAHPERLVTADWLSANMGAPGLAIVESDEDVLLYDVGHIPGAVKVDWHTDLNDPRVRDYINGEQFADLMNRKGIARDDTVVIYGDKSNWWAAYALWVFTLFGHPDVRLLNGGRDLWLADRRETTLDVPTKTSTGYPVVQRNDEPDPRVQGRRAGHPRQPAADRRALARGVHRQAHPHARLPRGRRAARRPHPHRPCRFRGARRPTRAADSAAARSWKSCTASSTRTTRPSSIAASASGPATPGSCSPICWASPECATTTDRGPSGATPCACRSSRAKARELVPV